MEKKIAVKVNNQQEYDAFKNHCEEVGYKNHQAMGCEFDPAYPNLQYEYEWIGYSDFGMRAVSQYEIISFPTFAKLKGINLPPSLITIEMPNDFTATVYHDKVNVFSPRGTGCTLSHQEVIEIYTAMKSLNKSLDI